MRKLLCRLGIHKWYDRKAKIKFCQYCPEFVITKDEVDLSKYPSVFISRTVPNLWMNFEEIENYDHTLEVKP